MAWLNPKGHRELALKNMLTKWWSHIAPGIRKRISVSILLLMVTFTYFYFTLKDVNTNARLPEARRSTRVKTVHDITKTPYMQWQNRRAVNPT